MMFFREDSGNVSLMIDIKMANYPPGKSSVTVDLKQPDEATVKLIPFKGDYKIRNKMYEEFGEEWTLFYHGDPELEKGNFWIQIKGITDISLFYMTRGPTLLY